MWNKLFITLLFICYVLPIHAEEIRVAAAANLRYVLAEITPSFEESTGHQLAVSYAASGTLTTQILHGAPYDVFLSASPDYIQRLIKSELTKGKLVDIAQAQLALFASHTSLLNIDEGLKSLSVALKTGRLNKVAIANPRHAPYGKTARYELEKEGIWEQIQPYLILAENASQAVQFSLASEVDAAIIPYSHLIQPQLASKGRFVKLEETLLQQAIQIRGAKEETEQFLLFMQTDKARTLLKQHGFLVE